jgi:hypothetical protein
MTSSRYTSLAKRKGKGSSALLPTSGNHLHSYFLRVLPLQVLEPDSLVLHRHHWLVYQALSLACRALQVAGGGETPEEGRSDVIRGLCHSFRVRHRVMCCASPAAIDNRARPGLSQAWIALDVQGFDCPKLNSDIPDPCPPPKKKIGPESPSGRRWRRGRWDPCGRRRRASPSPSSAAGVCQPPPPPPSAERPGRGRGRDWRRAGPGRGRGRGRGHLELKLKLNLGLRRRDGGFCPWRMGPMTRESGPWGGRAEDDPGGGGWCWDGSEGGLGGECCIGGEYASASGMGHWGRHG